jgi:DNA-binding transcriptional MerR regulator
LARFCFACGAGLVTDAGTAARSVAAADESRRSRQDMLLIGEVAERVGLSLRTVRYYEEMGLVDPARTEGGFRLYSMEDVKRLYVLKGMKPAGMALEEIRELMDLFDESETVERLNREELRVLVAGLTKHEARVEEGVDRLERHLIEVRKLYDRVRKYSMVCNSRLLELEAESADERAGPERQDVA